MMAPTASHQSRMSAQSAKPHRTTNQSEIQKSPSSRFIVDVRCWFSREMQPSKQRKEHPDRGTVGGEQPSKRKPDKQVVSGHSPVLPDDVGLAASAELGGAEAPPAHSQPVL